MKNTDIKKGLKKVSKIDNIVEKLTTFMKTSKGEEFVRKLHYAQIEELCKMYGQKYVTHTNRGNRRTMSYKHIYNIIDAAIKKAGITIDDAVVLHTEEDFKFKYNEDLKKLGKMMRLKKAHKKREYITKRDKNGKRLSITRGDIVKVTSEYINHTIPQMSKADYINAYVQHKLKKWEKNNPKPITNDGSKDLFEKEFMPQWEEKRNEAIDHIRKFVLKIYDNKFTLTGRYKNSEGSYKNSKLAEIEDDENLAKNVNELDNTAKVISIAQSITNEEFAKNDTFIAANLKGKDGRGRIILPAA